MKKSQLKFWRQTRTSFAIATTLFAGTVGTANPAWAATNVWQGTTNASWFTLANWSLGVFPATGDIAQFAGTGTATSVGIDFSNASVNNGTLNEAVGAIDITSGRTAALTLSNSAASTTGTLTLNGASVTLKSGATLADVILHNNSSYLLTLAGSGSGTMGVVLNDATNNIISIEGSGGVAISSIIRNGAGNSLRLAGAGAGTLLLSGANTYTGGTTLGTSNTLLLGASGAVSAGGSIASSPVGTGVLTLGDGATLRSDSATSRTIQNGLSLSGAITLGSSSTGALTFNSTDGTTPLATAATATLTGNTTLTTNIATTIANAISGTGYSLTKAGSATLTLSGANTYSGGTFVNVGTLQLGAAGALASTGPLTVGVSGGTTASTFSLNGFSQTIGSLQFIGSSNSSASNQSSVSIGSGTLTINGPISFGTAPSSAYPSTISAGTGTLDLGGSTRAITVYSGINTSGDLVISAPIANGGINYTGYANATTQAVLSLSGNNTFTGGVTINAGVLLLSNAGALNSTTPNAVAFGSGAASGTSLRLNGNSVTVSALATSATTPGSPVIENVSSTAATLTVNNTGNSTFAGVLQNGTSSSALALTKNGTGTLTLAGANTYTGLTTINGGTLQVGTGGTAGTLGTGSVTNNATLAFNRPDTFTAANAINGNGAVQQIGGGTLVLSGVSTYTGGTAIQNGSVQVAGASDRLPTTGTVALGSATATGRLILGNTTAAANQTLGGLTATGSGGNVVGGNASTASVLATNIPAGNTNTYAGTLGGTSATENNLALSKSGDGTLALASANTYAGGTTVSGGTLTLAASGAAGSGAVTMSAGSLLGGNGTTHGNAVVIGSAASTNNGTVAGWDFSGLTGYGASPLAPTVAAGVTVIGLTRGSGVTTTGTAASNAWGGTDWQNTSTATAIAGGDVATFSLTASGGSLNLASIDAYNVRRTAAGPTTGQWQYSLDGTNFTNLTTPITWGSTTGSAGNVQAAIPLSSIGTIASGTTITFRVANYGGTSSAGTWYLNDPGATTSLDFTISGSTAVPASGTGTLGIVEGGSTTFTGPITVNNTASLTAAAGGAANFAGTISGSGSITKTDAGLVNLAGLNTYSGGTTVNAGSLQASNASNSSATGSGPVTVNSGGTLLGTGYINAGANVVTINGTLSPATTTTADTIHIASTAPLNTATATPTGALTLSSSSTLAFNLNGLLSKDLVDLGNSSLALNGGTLQLILPASFVYTTDTYTLITGISAFNGAFGNVTGYDSANYTPVFTLNGTSYDLAFAPVPEPATLLGGFLLVGAAGWSQRRRLRGLMSVAV